ncbi:uncharacterized protein [Eucyclogobius newberryi]|uniref:uncharacterized protein n=1 Tax=Eucyclogobius newberryi TaxID=166745 RepID=UPI003B5A6A59
MAQANSFSCEEQFECSICMDIFRNPVSLPCGHNFCNGCIRRHWEDKELCKCPLCKQEFNKSLQINVNTLLRDIVDSYKQDYVVSHSESPRGPEDVLCDCCLHSRRRAAQTCLVCLTSFCETHLKPHHSVASLKSHALTDPVPKLHEKICTKHNRIFEETSCGQTNVCVLCANNEIQSQSDKTCEDNKPDKDVHFIKIKNSRKKKKKNNNQAAPTMNKTEDNNETESSEDVHIWHNNILYSFSPLPPACGFSTGRIYYDVPNVGNSSCSIGVVNRKMCGKMFFSTKAHMRWVVRYDNFMQCPACLMCNIRFPDRVLLCVDYEQGQMFLVHPLDGIVLICLNKCNFKGELFLFTYHNTINPIANYLQGWTPVKSTREAVLAGIVVVMLVFILCNL